MKLTLLSCVFVIFAIIASGQDLKRSTNLVVRFEDKFDRGNNRKYYILHAEDGNPNATAVYNLISYKPERDAINTGGTFFVPENDTASAYYNYFTTPTAAMEYLGRRGWHLVTVISEVTSGYTYPSSSDRTFTTVSSRPVYYFKKEL